MSRSDGVTAFQACPSHPGDGEHELCQGSMLCAYCGKRVDPYPCHGCGRFMTADEMRRAADDGVNRCDRCV